jgi:uncharacterized membrane protein HdeD (DUF308 family)
MAEVVAPVVVVAARPEARAALVAAAVLAEVVAALAVVAVAGFPTAPEAESAAQYSVATAVRPAAAARGAPAAKARGQGEWCLAVLPKALGLAVAAAWAAFADPMASVAAMRTVATAHLIAEAMQAGSMLTVPGLARRAAGACRAGRVHSCQAAAAQCVTVIAERGIRG